MIEIYNELIQDLLEPSAANLELREDPVKGPTVAGMAELVALSADEVMDLLHEGNKNRTQEATEANATSSRSHAVLQVVVEQREVNPGPQSAVKIGKLSMIDLAGSERASATNNRG
jgi:kinesin family protein 18/19